MSYAPCVCCASACAHSSTSKSGAGNTCQLFASACVETRQIRARIPSAHLRDDLIERNLNRPLQRIDINAFIQRATQTPRRAHRLAVQRLQTCASFGARFRSGTQPQRQQNPIRVIASAGRRNAQFASTSNMPA
jgi:hypothetical protein